MSDIYKLQYGNTKSVHKYKYFKWELNGRWNQGSGNSGATATYMSWDELGIGFDNDVVCYGPDYWTFDNYTLDGTPWDPAARMPPVLLGGSWGTEYTKFDASNFVSLVIYFHTTSGEAILPTSIGLYSSNGQTSYQSSTPLHFILSGLNEETNEYEQLIDIGAADVNKDSTQLTTINSGFTYHYDVINLNRLIFPGWNGYLGYKEPELPYELVYLSYMTNLDGQNDIPVINKVGSVWNFNSRRTGTSNVSISGTMPNSYSGQKYVSFGGAGVTGILPVTSLRKFTICGWMRSNTSGAGEFWGIRYHTAFNFLSFYLADATNYLNFNFNLATSNYAMYEGTNIENAGCRCPTSIANKSGWAYVCLYIDRDMNRCEYWVNNHHIFDISGKTDLFGGAQNFDTILRFYPDANYSGFHLCELAIWRGQRKTDVPTEPLSNVYGG